MTSAFPLVYQWASHLTTCISHHASMCPPTTVGVNISFITDFHPHSLTTLKLSDLCCQPQQVAGRGQMITKKSKWINVWRGGTKESFMCCSSGHLTLSNYLASAFNGGVSMWDKSELTWMILKALGVRDKLTEWVLISLLRQSHTHTHGLAYRCDVNYPGGHTHEQMHLFAPTQAIDAFVSTRRIKTVTKFSEVKNVWRKSETS